MFFTNPSSILDLSQTLPRSSLDLKNGSSIHRTPQNGSAQLSKTCSTTFRSDVYLRSSPGLSRCDLAKITTTDATATPGKRKATTQLKPELPRKANASLCKTNDLNATCDLNATFTKLDKDSNHRDSNDFGSESYYVDKTPTSPASSMATSPMDVSHGTYAGKFQPGPNAVGTDEQLIALATAQDAVLADTNDLRKARDLDDLQKQKQALFGLPNQSIVPPRDDDLPSNTMDITLAHVNKMMSAKTVPPQLNQFGQTFTKAAASKERGLPVQFKIRITDLTSSPARSWTPLHRPCLSASA